MPLVATRRTSSSTAQCDGAQRRMRRGRAAGVADGSVVPPRRAAPIVAPVGGAAPNAAARMPSTCVFPVPGGPCTSARRRPPRPSTHAAHARAASSCGPLKARAIASSSAGENRAGGGGRGDGGRDSSHCVNGRPTQPRNASAIRSDGVAVPTRRMATVAPAKPSDDRAPSTRTRIPPPRSTMTTTASAHGKGSAAAPAARSSSTSPSPSQKGRATARESSCARLSCARRRRERRRSARQARASGRASQPRAPRRAPPASSAARRRPPPPETPPQATPPSLVGRIRGAP